MYDIPVCVRANSREQIAILRYGGYAVRRSKVSAKEASSIQTSHATPSSVPCVPHIKFVPRLLFDCSSNFLFSLFSRFPSVQHDGCHGYQIEILDSVVVGRCKNEGCAYPIGYMLMLCLPVCLSACLPVVG